MVARNPDHGRESRAQRAKRPLDVRRLFRYVPGDQQPVMRKRREALDELAVRLVADVQVADGEQPTHRVRAQSASPRCAPLSCCPALAAAWSCAWVDSPVAAPSAVPGASTSVRAVSRLLSRWTKVVGSSIRAPRVSTAWLNRT